MGEKRDLDGVKLQHGRSPRYEEELEAMRRRIAEKAANARRTRLYSFRLAGGRRG